jgi:hypothetical protein
MMASRGMGDIAPSKMPSGKRKARLDDTDFTQYAEGGRVAKYMKFSETGKPIGMVPVTKAEGGEVWDKKRPKSLGAPKPISPAKKAKAKAMAKAGGRPYPNLVDNMRAARSK